MAAQTAQNPPFARFRGGFGLSSRTREAKSKSGNEEDWYIPYNGPYEAPREPVRRPRPRDSWGDPVEDYDEDDGMLADRELHLRYGGHNDFNTRTSGGGRPVEEERKGRSRDRTFSVISGRTTSSGAVDPNRTSMITNRRSTVSSGNPPPMPSYVSLNAVGGVGESPIPVRSKDANRISFASIFSFGGKAASVLSLERSHSARKSTRLSRSNTEREGPYGRLESPTPPRQSSSSESRRPLDVNDSKLLPQADKVSLTATDEDDYYNSYYSTLLNKTDGGKRHLQQPYYQPRSPSSSGGSHNSLQPRSRENAGMSRQNSTSTSSGHPYAYVFPRTEIPEAPQTAPLIPTPHTTQTPGHPNPPRLTFTTPLQQQGPNSADAAHSAFSPRSAGVKSLKNSTSTPNLRNQVIPGQTMAVANANNVSTFAFPKGKDRWLSAETWCDALLFPRPRLKLKHDPVEGPIVESSGRIVSPPGTPLAEDFGMQQQQQREPGIASRVLAHSRSLVDLNNGRSKTQDIQHPHASTSKDPQISARAQTLRPPRPKSFALDDLALPTPTPSLAHVLREGQLLDSERREWQMQATNSFGNKRTRSMSRTRSKSLTQKGRQGKHQHQSSMEYIAARACLGAQPLTPTIVPPRLNMSISDGNTATMSSGRVSHSHTNSLVKTLTKSSKSHSRNHSRSDSWSKSAIKMAKSTVICGYPAADSTASLNGGNSKAADLEGALKRNETKVIRLADPAHLPVDRGQPIQPTQYLAQRHTPSPAESRLSDSKVGIALGTPPEEDLDYIPNHPYAQGGLSFSNAPGPSTEHHRHVDYAGPHPSINTGLKAPPISEIIARHKLPPHMVLHPYAHPAARDSYLDANGLVGQFRSMDSTPNPSKMWAQLSPGVIREILPGDLQYSPLMPVNGSNSPQDRQTIIINDTVGVGEALVNAARFSGRQDHDIGISEGRATHQQQQHTKQRSHDQPQDFKDLNLSEFGPSSRRHGVQFELSQPLDLEESQPSSDLSANASSHLEYLPMPPVDRAQSVSPAATSDSSLQHSPRPLGSPNDLESFQDLFYRPAGHLPGRTPVEAALPETPSPPNRSSTPWELNMPNRRTGSSLTSLARQLSEEFDQMALERERSSSQYSQSPSSSYRHAGQAKRPGEGSLQFVFEEMPLSGSPERDSLAAPIHAFKPSETLPEDIQSSRASSFIENAEEDDPTVNFRVGMVESVSTPTALSSDHHVSFEQTAFIHNRPEKRETLPHDDRIVSALHPPTDATRSSYMTTSTVSRMSGLSDFPAPPKDDHLTPKHMSVISSYFDEVLTQSEARSRSHPPPPPVPLAEHRVTFGGNQNASDVARTLSSHPHPPF